MEAVFAQELHPILKIHLEIVGDAERGMLLDDAEEAVEVIIRKETVVLDLNPAHDEDVFFEQFVEIYLLWGRRLGLFRLLILRLFLALCCELRLRRHSIILEPVLLTFFSFFFLIVVR